MHADTHGDHQRELGGRGLSAHFVSADQRAIEVDQADQTRGHSTAKQGQQANERSGVALVGNPERGIDRLLGFAENVP